MTMRLCSHCGSLLDAARENPKTKRYERKCPDCLQWHPLPAADQLTGRLRRRAVVLPSPRR